MGLQRNARKHDTEAVRKNAHQNELWWDFQPGERVMTREGIAGTVDRVEDGFTAGAEQYIVTLDAGMGGGEYASSELSRMNVTQAAKEAGEIHLASEDYPELGNILNDRPPLESNPDSLPPMTAGLKAEAMCPECSGWALCLNCEYDEQHGERKCRHPQEVGGTECSDEYMHEGQHSWERTAAGVTIDIPERPIDLPPQGAPVVPMDVDLPPLVGDLAQDAWYVLYEQQKAKQAEGVRTESSGGRGWLPSDIHDYSSPSGPRCKNSGCNRKVESGNTLCGPCEMQELLERREMAALQSAAGSFYDYNEDVLTDHPKDVEKAHQQATSSVPGWTPMISGRYHDHHTCTNPATCAQMSSFRLMPDGSRLVVEPMESIGGTLYWEWENWDANESTWVSGVAYSEEEAQRQAESSFFDAAASTPAFVRAASTDTILDDAVRPSVRSRDLAYQAVDFCDYCGDWDRLGTYPVGSSNYPDVTLCDSCAKGSGVSAYKDELAYEMMSRASLKRVACVGHIALNILAAPPKMVDSFTPEQIAKLRRQRDEALEKVRQRAADEGREYMESGPIDEMLKSYGFPDDEIDRIIGDFNRLLVDEKIVGPEDVFTRSAAALRFLLRAEAGQFDRAVGYDIGVADGSHGAPWGSNLPSEVGGMIQTPDMEAGYNEGYELGEDLWDNQPWEEKQYYSRAASFQREGAVPGPEPRYINARGESYIDVGDSWGGFAVQEYNPGAKGLFWCETCGDIVVTDPEVHVHKTMDPSQPGVWLNPGDDLVRAASLQEDDHFQEGLSEGQACAESGRPMAEGLTNALIKSWNSSSEEWEAFKQGYEQGYGVLQLVGAQRRDIKNGRFRNAPFNCDLCESPATDRKGGVNLCARHAMTFTGALSGVPEEYFDFDPTEAEAIPLDRLVPTKPPASQPNSVARAEQFMEQAAQGLIPKRGPITVSQMDDGNYEIIDGNATFGVAEESGWEYIPAKLALTASLSWEEVHGNVSGFMHSIGQGVVRYTSSLDDLTIEVEVDGVVPLGDPRWVVRDQDGLTLASGTSPATEQAKVDAESAARELQVSPGQQSMFGSKEALSTGPSYRDGIMICLRPTPEQAQKLAVESGLTPEDIHVTLAYLGKTADHDSSMRDEIMHSIRLFAENVTDITDDSLTGEVTAVTIFAANDSKPMVAIVDAPGLGQVRAALVSHLKARQEQTGIPVYDAIRQDHDFTAHATLGYEATMDDIDLSKVSMPLTFSGIELNWGTDKLVRAFGQHHDKTAASDLRKRVKDNCSVNDGGCWLWKGTSTNGYGKVSVDGQMVRAHKALWEDANGKVPKGKELDHTCENTKCCNPAHLKAVTRQKNIDRRYKNLDSKSSASRLPRYMVGLSGQSDYVILDNEIEGSVKDRIIEGPFPNKAKARRRQKELLKAHKELLKASAVQWQVVNDDGSLAGGPYQDNEQARDAAETGQSVQRTFDPEDTSTMGDSTSEPSRRRSDPYFRSSLQREAIVPWDRMVKNDDILWNAPSYDWCRFRRDSRCYYPKQLDVQGTKAMGYPVWVPEDRGYCHRIKWTSQEKCEVSEPGPHAKDEPIRYTDATVPYSAGGQRGGEPTDLMWDDVKAFHGSRETPVEIHRASDSPAQVVARLGHVFEFTAAWRDVQSKASRIRRGGNVRIIAAAPSRITAEVKGDTSIYQTSVMRVPGTKQVAMWECGCEWAKYSWGRSGRWKRYEGRMCSHALALTYEAQSQEFGGGTLTEQRKNPWPGEKVKRWQEPSAPRPWRLSSLASQRGIVFHPRTARFVEPAPGTTLTDIARDVRSVVLPLEPQVTRELENIANVEGGDLVGTEWATKPLDSFFRKLKLYQDGIKSWDSATGDLLRYTFTFHEMDYSQAVLSTMDKLQGMGYRMTEQENSWAPNDPYSGYHIKVERNGVPIEVQFHSDDSFHLKEKRTHKMYEEFRDRSTDPVRKAQLWDIMSAMSLDLDIPHGAIGLPSGRLEDGAWEPEGLRLYPKDPTWPSDRSHLVGRVPWLAKKAAFDPELATPMSDAMERQASLSEFAVDFAAQVFGRIKGVIGIVGDEVILDDGTLHPGQEILHPNYHPSAGLNFREAAMASTDAELKDEPEAALPSTTAEGEDEGPVEIIPATPSQGSPIPPPPEDDEALFEAARTKGDQMDDVEVEDTDWNDTFKWAARDEDEYPETRQESEVEDTDWGGAFKWGSSDQTPSLEAEAATQPGDSSLEWLMGTSSKAAAAQRQGGGFSDGDIAGAARAFLDKTAMKNFSAAEQAQLINEGADDHRMARNADKLDIDGTHYMELEAAYQAQGAEALLFE